MIGRRNRGRNLEDMKPKTVGDLVEALQEFDSSVPILAAGGYGEVYGDPVLPVSDGTGEVIAVWVATQ